MTDPSGRYVTVDGEQAERLSRHVSRRMIERGFMTQAAFEEASGVSVATIRPLLKGVPRNYWPAKLREVSAALWDDPLHIDRLLRGDEVAELDDRGPSFDERLNRVEDTIASLNSQLAAIRQMIERLGTSEDAPRARGGAQ